MADGIADFLRAVEDADFTTPPPPTFMEIAGFPYWETATSNILAHFMDPGAGHGLGTLVLESFLDAAKEPYDGSISVEEVATEVRTTEGKRIDIVVKTDQLVIGIENKIYAPLVNDLDDYNRHLERIAGGRAKPCLYVLGLRDPAQQRQELPVGYRRELFVSYGSFLDTLEGRKRGHEGDANATQVAYLVDFIGTIRNLIRGLQMDVKFMALMETHHRAIDLFLQKQKELQRVLRSRLQSVAKCVNTPSGWHQHYWRDPAKPRDVLVYTRPWEGGASIRVEARLARDGWTITVHTLDWDLSTPLVTLLERALPGRRVSLWAENENRFELSRFEFGVAAAIPAQDLNEILTALEDDHADGS